MAVPCTPCTRARTLGLLAIAAAVSATTNRFVGPAGSVWFGDAADWSQGSFPSYPQAVALDKALALTKATNGAARRLEVVDSILTVSGAELTLAPTSCDATQYQAPGGAPTATADRVCLDTVTCAAHEWETSARTTTAHRVCAAHTVCGAHEYERAPGTPLRDRVCATKQCGCADGVAATGSACPAHGSSHCVTCFAGFWRTADHRCVRHTVCAASEYVVYAGSATADRQCATKECRCPNGTAAAGVACPKHSAAMCSGCVGPRHLANGNQQCDLNICSCAHGEAATNAACTAHGAAICVRCHAGHFLVGSACVPHTVCRAGEYVAQEGSAENDRACAPCPAEMWSGSANAAQCADWAICPVGFGQSRPGSPSQDRKCAQCKAGASFSATVGAAACAPLLACASNEYQTAAPTSSSDRECATHSAACPEGQYTHASPNAFADRVCRAILVCAHGMYETAAPSVSSNRVCAACKHGTFKTKAGSQACLPWSTCSPGMHQTLSGSTTYDITCGANVCTCEHGTPATKANCVHHKAARCAVCNRGFFLSHRRCLAHKVCAPGSFESVAGTGTTDAECQTHKAPCAAAQYETKAPGTHHDRECEAHTVCDASQWEATAAGTHSDRVCKHCDALSCARWEKRIGCGEGSKGTCVFNCAAGNCYIGAEKGTWFHSVASWSRYSFPAFPQAVRASKDVVIAQRARGTSRDLLIHDASLLLEADLEIGPRMCDASEDEQVAPTATTNTVCKDKVTCTATQFETRAMTPEVIRQCQDHTTCGDAQYETKAAGTYHDRVCASHSTCTGTQWETKAAGTHHDRVCQAHTTCTPSQWESVAAGTHNDRACMGHTLCTATQWMVSDGDAHADRVCENLTTCSRAEFMSTAPTLTSDRACTPMTTCTASQWETAPLMLASDRECAEHTVCKPNEWQTKGAGAYHDRECQALTTCGVAEWQTLAPSAVSDRRCAAHTTCASTQWQTVAAGTHHDRQCKDHTTCTATQWQTRASGTHYDRQCKDHTTCTATQWETKASGTHHDRQCMDHTTCTTTQWQTKASGTRHDRECKDHTVCSSLQWQTKASGTHHDRKCKEHTTCKATQWQTKAPGTHHDRECQDHTTCTATQWETKASGTHHDRQCKDHTTCTGMQWQSTAAGPYNDRKCTVTTVCKANEWETVAPTLTSDRSCKPHTVCIGTEYETKAAGKYNDRTCASHTVCIYTTQWESKEEGTHHDRECTALTICSAMQWETTAKTATSDRICVDHTRCLPSQYETRAAGAFNDRECATCTRGHACDGSTTRTVCAPGNRQFQDETGQLVCKDCAACADGETRRACGGASAGYCKSCMTGWRKVSRFECEICPSGTYELGRMACEACSTGRHAEAGATGCTSCDPGFFQPASGQHGCLACDGGWTHDRGAAMPDPHLAAGHTGCTTYNVCSATQWETVAKTLTSDRECAEHTTCLAGLEWAHVTAGTHRNRECSPLTVCTATEWESVAPGPANDRGCTSRGSCLVTVDDAPAYYPSHAVDGDPTSTTERVSARDATTSSHFYRVGGGEPLTDLFDNIHFTTEGAGPVQNERCAGGWCMSNGGDAALGHCVNDGEWGWSFYRPVKRVALSTPDLANFKSASVWIYDEAGMVLDKRTLGATHEGNQFLAFKSTCHIAKVRLQIHDYVEGSKFCLSQIWYDGEEQAKPCTLTTCRQETHTCEHWRKDALGIVAPRHVAAGRCAPGGVGGACSANGNCDGVTSHSSIRVYHRLHDTQMDPHSGWLLKDEASKLEKNCYVHHRCGMGVVTGDTSECQCKQM